MIRSQSRRSHSEARVGSLVTRLALDKRRIRTGDRFHEA